MNKSDQKTVNVLKSALKEIERYKQILIDICNNFETEGCLGEGCGTVDTATINKARKLLGWNKL